MNRPSSRVLKKEGGSTSAFAFERCLDRFDLSEKNAAITERFRQEFQLSEGDVLVIEIAADRGRAVKGVLGAAESLH
jgi:hypothetical protein